ncbi:hypothetical protein L6172_01120 [Thalassospiraceae bacterium SW-3-3]|nr:hypothetical protein L6172_01120 [Thalassospiraceae bacterium SW-3-3]
MSDTVKRFKRRQELSKRTSLSNPRNALQAPRPTKNSPDAVLSKATLCLDNGDYRTKHDANTLLTELHNQLNTEKIEALIEACQRNCLQTVVRPFVLGRALFNDQDGGNVDTIHNVRDGVYATDRERDAYKNRGDYDDRTKPYSERTKNAVHLDQRYIEENRRISEQRDSGGVKDAYADEVRSTPDKIDQDHVVSGKQTHEDAGRVLAEVSTVDAANLQENRVATDRSINRSKNAKDPMQFAQWLEDTAQQRKARMSELLSKPQLSDQERKELSKLKKLDQADPNAIREHATTAKEAQDRKYNKAYYTSTKFAKSVALSSAKEGGQMALQQALGVLMEEFVKASFAEVRDAWQNGFKGAVDDSFLEALKERLSRVAQRVQTKWKDAAYALRDGFISGFLSNLVTVLINTFATTLKRYVRMIREGGMSLYRAIKVLVFPDEGMSMAEAADAALKILVAGLVTATGIAVQSVLGTYFDSLGVVGEFALEVSVGLATGIATACTMYLLDKLDIFGIQEEQRNQKVLTQLRQAINISHAKGMEAAKIFDGPAPLHLS